MPSNATIPGLTGCWLKTSLLLTRWDSTCAMDSPKVEAASWRAPTRISLGLRSRCAFVLAPRKQSEGTMELFGVQAVGIAIKPSQQTESDSGRQRQCVHVDARRPVHSHKCFSKVHHTFPLGCRELSIFRDQSTPIRLLDARADSMSALSSSADPALGLPNS